MATCASFAWRCVLRRVRCASPQNDRFGVHLQLCDCWRICGVLHRLEPDPGVPDRHSGRGFSSQQHVRLAGQSQHQWLHDKTPGHGQRPRSVPPKLLLWFVYHLQFIYLSVREDKQLCQRNTRFTSKLIYVMLNNKSNSWYLKLCPSVSGKGEDTYLDVLALFIALLVTAVIALGVRNTVGFNNVLNVVNLVVWVFMIIAGLFFISSSNWEGGKFLPYGWSGVRNCFAKGALSTNFQLPIKRLHFFWKMSAFLWMCFCTCQNGVLSPQCHQLLGHRKLYDCWDSLSNILSYIKHLQMTVLWIHANLNWIL